jgi:hypothetical protein
VNQYAAPIQADDPHLQNDDDRARQATVRPSPELPRAIGLLRSGRELRDPSHLMLFTKFDRRQELSAVPQRVYPNGQWNADLRRARESIGPPKHRSGRCVLRLRLWRLLRGRRPLTITGRLTTDRYRWQSRLNSPRSPLSLPAARYQQRRDASGHLLAGAQCVDRTELRHGAIPH